MSYEVAADAPTAVEHGASSAEMPQFSADLFAGPCFGDLSPSETLPDAPSPSPLLLNSFPDSNTSLQSAHAPETDDLIDVTDVQESTSPPSELESSQNQILDPSISLMNSSPVHYALPQAPSISSISLPSSVDNFTDHSSMLHLHDSSDISFLSISASANKQSLAPEPFEPFHGSFEQSGSDYLSKTHKNVLPDLSSAELDESSLNETTEPLTQTMLIDIAPNENANILVLPSSSPTDGPTSSPPFPPPRSSSQPSSDAIDPFSYLSSFPITPEHTDSTHSNVSSLGPYEPEAIDFPTSSPPPSSSPELIFSSPPAVESDDSSILEASPKPMNMHMSLSSTDLPPPSPPQHYTSPQMHNLESLDQGDLNARSSSSSMPSSPRHLPQYSTSTQMHTLESSNQDVFDNPPTSSPISNYPLDLPQHLNATQMLNLESLNQDYLDAPPSSSPMPSSDPMYSIELMEQQPPPLSTEEVSDSPSPKPGQEEIHISKTTSVDLSVNFSGQQTDDAPTSVQKRKRGDEETREITTQPPNPKRPTLASQKLQRKTLVKPFRSPAMVAPKAPEPTPSSPVRKQDPASAEQLPKADLKKHRTQRAAGQFKSPLPLPVSSIPSVRPTPTIQALERKVQVLRRAVKVKQGGEEQALEALVKKWTEAGREVAWEVWALIKDQENGSGEDWGKDSKNATSEKRKFEDSWGWNEESGSKKVKTEWDNERNWGWETSPNLGTDDHPPEQRVESEAEEKPRETLGTMLMRLGIAPSTLGWNDEEEEFVDL